MNRAQLQERLFPAGIPRLWCPPLTYFSQARQLDAERIEQHLTRLSAHVRGLLVPGSTGEGWEMSDPEIDHLLGLVLPIAQRLDMKVTIGILKTSTAEVISAIEKLSSRLIHPACVGLTVCPPKGAELSQGELLGALYEVLTLGYPTALYQLPQVTQNELHPATVERLFGEFQNIILFKDTSGEDRVALADIETDGVFLVRGAERGGYGKWLKSVGGPYDGFLLSTANCFASQLEEIANSTNKEDAEARSKAVEAIVTAAFEIVAAHPHGNAFTNANKVIDHLKTYHRRYDQIASPMLYNGSRLPREFCDTLAARFPELVEE